jgi:O-antigen/teichoic acid export membrane protein
MDNQTPNKIENSNNQILNDNVVNISLQKIFRESGIIFIGMIIGMFLVFIGRILLIRVTSPSEYGIYSLALVLINVFSTISVLGLGDGTARCIAFFRGKDDLESARNVVRSSLQIVLISGVIFSIILFFSSEMISKNIFHDVNLILPLQILTLGIPLLVFINTFAAIFRGYGSGAPKVFFQDTLINILFLCFLIVIVILNLSFISIFYAYIASITIVCVVFGLFTIRKMSSFGGSKKLDKHSGNVTRYLLFFSMPLLIISILNNVLHWTDTLMLGYFKTSSVVGIYNGAISVVVLLPTIFTAAAFIFIPISTELYAKNMIGEMGKCYQILTKWVFLGTIPIFFMLVMFPEISLNFLFGPKYSDAALPLIILAFGSMFSIFLGFNGLSLIAMGRTKFIMVASLTSVLSNVIIDVLLIPSLGMIGAAIGSLLSVWIFNILKSIKLYQLSKVHPFSKNFNKLLGISLILFVVFYLVTIFIKIEIWIVPILFILFVIIYIYLSFKVNIFDKDDSNLLIALEKNLGINFHILKKLKR